MFYCLVAGQAEQWSEAAQSVLATAHLQLDVLYIGLEDAAAAKVYRYAILMDDSLELQCPHLNSSWTFCAIGSECFRICLMRKS